MEIEINGKSYLIDIEKALQAGVLKEKDTKPRSWEEYSDKYEEKVGHYTNASDIDAYDAIQNDYRCYDTFHTEDEAKAFCALGKLIQLRDAWWGEWKPNWNNGVMDKCYICFSDNEISTGSCSSLQRILSFPTAKMRNDFLSTFRELIETAKMFL